jgi:hypothetical protein
MAVDPKKPRKILVVHGVQYGKSSRLKHDKTVEELINNRLGGNPVKFKTELYAYEDINDNAQQAFKKFGEAMVKTPIEKVVFNAALDITGDVIINLINGDVAKDIKSGLKDRILKIFEDGHPCYIVAHSLGTIYTFDVINELMKDSKLFDRGSRKTWPVQGMMTLGSPIGLAMFRNKRKKVASFGSDEMKFFKWLNYFDLTDPIVSGAIFGKTLTKLKIAEPYLDQSQTQGWIIRDKSLDTGKVWLSAHSGYWQNPQVGDDLVDLISN